MNNDGLYPPMIDDPNTFRVHSDDFKPPPTFPYPTFCRDPNHHPGVLMISLQPGQVYEHVCPTCRTATRITQYHPMLNEKDERV